MSLSDKAYMRETEILFGLTERVEIIVAHIATFTLDDREKLLRHLDAIRSMLGTHNITVRDDPKE